jgi:cysteine desulfurase/selenocysteine lyase
MITYLDNSATSWPKPPVVAEAISQYLTLHGVSPGRSAHSLSLKAAREVFETRELLARFFNNQSSEKVIFSANATHALNTAIKGLLKKGDHVIISSMEHNSVVRPIRYLEDNGLVEVSVAQCDQMGVLDPCQVKNLIRKNTKLVICNHGSNVTGTIQDVAQIGNICKENNILFLVDAAQTAGYIPIDMNGQNIDILVFTGHKRMHGPTGIGGLCINGNVEIETLVHGGTGSRSESEAHPDFLPDRLEAGTLNTVGIVGLKAGLEFTIQQGLQNLQRRQNELTQILIDELKTLGQITLLGSLETKSRLPVISINSSKYSSSELSHLLDSKYRIMTRAGLHCAPMAHKTLKTFPMGTLRFSIGSFNTQEQINHTVKAIKELH